MSRLPDLVALAIVGVGLPLRTGALAGQQSPEAPAAAPTPAPKPCTAPEYRQFDFWIGSWDVVDPKGEPQGSNVIGSILGGCVLQESWTGLSGMVGTSFNIWDVAAKRWRQSWVDNQGLVLLLEGEFRDDKMVLEGRRPARKGGTALHRITWNRIGGDPDRVRQLWEVSPDDGKSWQILFDGTYRRKS
ncbi:MAG: hypothetical protein ACRD3M_08620 [Thermoanaerobaculia bacterium]